ncbi:MAG: hypothetical protein PHP98_10545 [Kiritimatiellae bacterium]|nr:hypothetical protein [Kiritimatiellia bacterium]
MSKLPFDNASFGGVAVEADEFVHGSGSLTLKGEDTASTTADGRIHNDRLAVNFEGSCELYGDRRDLDSPAGAGQAVVFNYGETPIHSGAGIVSAEYSKEKNTTSISVAGDPA